MFVYPKIDPVAIDFGTWQLPFATVSPKIHWYGLMYLAGFSLFYLLGRSRCQKANAPITVAQLGDFLFYAAMGLIIGARLGYALFYNFPVTLHNPLSILAIWQGGMSFHGGLLGVTLVTWFYAHKILKTRIWALTDFIAPLAPLGLLCGRIGNFINGELWGREVAPDFIFATLHEGKFKHPSMLYEATLEGLVLFLLLWFYSRKPRPLAAVSGLFLLGYGAARFSVEFVRLPDEQIGYLAGNWLTMGHLLTMPMILIGAGMMIFAYRQQRARGAH